MRAAFIATILLHSGNGKSKSFREALRELSPVTHGAIHFSELITDVDYERRRKEFWSGLNIRPEAFLGRRGTCLASETLICINYYATFRGVEPFRRGRRPIFLICGLDPLTGAVTPEISSASEDDGEDDDEPGDNGPDNDFAPSSSMVDAATQTEA